MSKRLEALLNAVIVKPVEVEEQVFGNIIVPDIDKQKNETGVVITVGPGMYSVTGNFLPTVCKPGDIVILPTMTFTTFEFKNEKYYIGRENDILARITDDEIKEEELPF